MCCAKVGREQVRAALESGGQRYDVSFDLVAMNPSFVTGFLLSPLPCVRALCSWRALVMAQASLVVRAIVIRGVDLSLFEVSVPA